MHFSFFLLILTFLGIDASPADASIASAFAVVDVFESTFTAGASGDFLFASSRSRQNKRNDVTANFADATFAFLAFGTGATASDKGEKHEDQPVNEFLREEKE